MTMDHFWIQSNQDLFHLCTRARAVRQPLREVLPFEGWTPKPFLCVQQNRGTQLRAVEILRPLGLGVCCLSRGLGFWLSYASMVVAVADAIWLRHGLCHGQSAKARVVLVLQSVATIQRMKAKACERNIYLIPREPIPSFIKCLTLKGFVPNEI